MRILTDNTVTVGWVVSKVRPPQWAATFIVKGTYRFQPDAPATPVEEPEPLLGDVYQDDDPGRSLRYPSDFAVHKPRADVIVVGRAYAPGGEPVRELGVRIGVGQVSKMVRVLGDRVWRRTVDGDIVASAPEPFTTLPLTYEHAFGGPGFGRNPIGRGRGSSSPANVEPIHDPGPPQGRAVEPAGFGALACTWDQRRSLLGTYDEKWLKERWPWFPGDFNWGYFNAAPGDQQLDAFPRGDEAVLLQNLHPEYAVFRSSLPAARARCFISDRAPGGRLVFREVPLRLDTIWIDATELKLALVWRGLLEVRSFKVTEIEEVYACTERLAEPERPREYYRDLLTDLQTEKEDPAEQAAEAEWAARDAAFDQEIAALRAHFDALDREHEQMELDARTEEAGLLAAHRDRLRAEGVDPGRLDAPPPTAAPTGGTSIAGFGEFRAQAPEQVRQTEAMALELDRLEQVEREMDDFEKEFQADEPILDRAAVMALASKGNSLCGRNLRGLDLSGLDLGGADLADTILVESNLSRASLGGANLARADLRKANLSEADLSSTILDDADLSGANVSGARFSEASLSDATFAGLDLSGLDFSRCRGTGVDFSKSNLAAATFSEAALAQASFEGATLDRATFRAARLPAARFQEARGHEIDFRDADITGIHASEGCDFTRGNFQRVTATGAVFEQAVLTGADFSRAGLARAQFGEASLRLATVDRADLSYCSFDDADLRQATLTNSNFLRAGFDRANLTQANLRGSNLYEAGFWEAVLDGADFRTANLKGTVLG